MRVHPSVPATCAAVALLASVGTPALAAEPAVPAAGSASSLVSLLSVSAAGHDLAAGGVRLLTDTVDGTPVARIVVTPLVADGTPYGTQTLEAGSSRTVAPVSSSTVVPALAGIAELTGPALEVGASILDGAPTATAGAGSLGAVSVLGLPVGVDGVLKAGSSVGGTAAQSSKVLEVTGVALPSIADLLAALGLDLSKLPIDVVNELVTRLDLVTPAVTAANAALDEAQALVKTQTDAAAAEVTRQLAAVEAATAGVVTATAAVDPLTSGVLGQAAAQQAAQQGLAAANATLAQREAAAAAARTTLATAQAALTALPLLGTLPTVRAAAQAAVDTASMAVTEADALVAAAATAASRAAADVAAASTAAELTAAALAAARSAVVLAQSALDAANRLLDAAQKALADITATLLPQVRALLAVLTAVLDGTPLVSLDSVSVRTESVVTSASVGGQRAGVQGGEVQGLRVLGTDVLDDVLGRSTLSVTDLTGSTLAAVTAAVTGLTGTLSDVLSTVPGLPALKVPAPRVELLSKVARTAVDGDFGTATTSVTGLTVTLPAITLPIEVALPGALSLPGLSVLPAAALPAGVRSLAVGDVLSSSEATLGFGTLTETARFRPAALAAAAPTTGVPTAGVPTAGVPTTGAPTAGAPTTTPTSLPRTGAQAGLGLLALVLVGGAVVLRRRELSEG